MTASAVIRKDLIYVTLSLRMRFENDNMGIDCYINNKVALIG